MINNKKREAQKHVRQYQKFYQTGKWCPRKRGRERLEQKNIFEKIKG